MTRLSQGPLALALLLAACGGEDSARPPPRSPRPVVPVASVSVAPPDALGPRPELRAPTPFTPPVPVAYKRPNGMTVWLLERHALPIVSIQIVLPAGAASDPAGKGGLALETASMLDEGAGSRGALEIARDIDRLGATLQTGAYADYAFAQLTTLKKNLAPATAILGDVVARPRMSPVEWKRVHELWMNELRARQSEPDAVGNVVVSAKVYGPSHPYGHPTNGTLASAAKVSLEDITRFYAQFWHPESATIVVVGDVTREELNPLLDKTLAPWKGGKAGNGAGQPSPLFKLARRVVIVDRPDAPQSVITLAHRGVAASSAEAPALVRVNAALGGSFTSRLNQDLREEHGWSYGAKSRFSFSRMQGMFVAQAAVHTDHTGEALRAMLKDIDVYAKEGPSGEEADKTRLLARAELVESFESVESATRRLGRNAGVGLAPDHDAKASVSLYGATTEELRKLAAAYVDPSGSVIVIVGPKAKLEPQLAGLLGEMGITQTEASGPEGE